MTKKEAIVILLKTVLVATVFPFFLVVILPILFGENIFYLSTNNVPELRESVVFRQTLWFTAWCYSALYLVSALFNKYYKVVKVETK